MTLPNNAVILNELRIVEYMDSSGDVYMVDASKELETDKQKELVSFAQDCLLSALIAEHVHDYFYNEDNDI